MPSTKEGGLALGQPRIRPSSLKESGTGKAGRRWPSPVSSLSFWEGEGANKGITSWPSSRCYGSEAGAKVAVRRGFLGEVLLLGGQ